MGRMIAAATGLLVVCTAAADPKPQNVTVTNPSLNVQVANPSLNVHVIDPSLKLELTNTNPISVTVQQQEPFHTMVQQTIYGATGAGGALQIPTYVPAGKALVIEKVSATLQTGDFSGASHLLLVGVRTEPTIEIESLPCLALSAALGTYVCSDQTQFYVPAGQMLVFMVNANFPSATNIQVSLYVAGHFVPAS